MSKFQQTKSGVAVCPFFTWIGKNNEGCGHTEYDVSLVHCTHPKNKIRDYEGNCTEKGCPLINNNTHDNPEPLKE